MDFYADILSALVIGQHQAGVQWSSFNDQQ